MCISAVAGLLLSWGRARSWGVGVQNMAREYLPRSALARAAGDGLLRLQARASYKCHLMQHPLHDWMPAIFPLAGAHSYTVLSHVYTRKMKGHPHCPLGLWEGLILMTWPASRLMQAGRERQIFLKIESACAYHLCCCAYVLASGLLTS